MAINLDILAAVKGLNNLKKVEASLKTIRTQGVKGFQQLVNWTRRHNGVLAKNNEFLSRSADRIGFMAFQFTFLEGIAQRVLGGIQRFFTDIIDQGAGGIEAMVRAVAQSGIDFSGTTKDSADAVKFLNDALFDMASGGTIFNMQEVGEAMKEIGKATDLTGTEMEKSNKLVGVTQQVLRMMTIEEVQADEAAKTLIKTMNNFGLSLSEAARVTNVMINVNQSSAITLDELSRSFGFASSQARDFGLDVEQTGALIGVLGNRLGQGAGAAGRNFRQLLVGLKKEAIKFNPILQEMGVSLLDNEGNIKPFLQFLKETKTALDEAGESSDAFKLFLEQQLGLEVRAADALAKLTQATTEEIDRAVEAARSGDSSALEELFGSTPQANIKKMKNAVESLKIQFVGGLAPAITELTETITSLVRDTGLQEMMVELGQQIGNEIVPIVKEFVKAIKAMTKVFLDNKGALGFLIKGFILFIQLMIAMLIVASVGKVIAAFTSLIMKLSLALGTGQTAGATGAMGGMVKQGKTLRFTMLTIIAVVAGIIIAVFAFRDLLVTLTDDVDNSTQGMDILVASLLTLGGVALAGIIGGLPGLLLVLGALTAIAAITWLEQIGALDAFKEKWDEVWEGVGDKELSDLETFAVGFKAWSEGMEALGEVVGLNIGEHLAAGIFDIQDKIDETDWGKLWAAIEDANLDLAWEIAQNIGKNFVDSFRGFLLGVLGLAPKTNEVLQAMPSKVYSDAEKAGIAAGNAVRDGFIIGLTENLGESLLKALETALGPVLGPMIVGIIRGLDKGIKNQALRKGIAEGGGGPDLDGRFSDDVLQDRLGKKNSVFVDGQEFSPAPTDGAGIGELVAINDMEQLISGEFIPSIQWSAESLLDTAEQLETMNEPLTEMAEETMLNANESFKISTEGMKEMKKNTDDASAKVVAFTRTTKLGDIGQQVNTIRVKALTTQEQALGETMDIWQFEIARLVNITIDTQGSMVSAQSALTKLAIEGAEAARRLSTLKVSSDGKFSMSGRSTSTTFGERGLASAIPRILATELGEKINLIELAKAQEQRQQTVNNTINITIEGAADDETAQRTAEAVQEVLSKEIEDKSILTSTGTV